MNIQGLRIIQNWFKTWNFTFRKLSESQDGKIHSYIPITVKKHKWKKKNLKSNKMDGDGTKTGPKANFSTVTKTEARRQWNTIFIVLRENTSLSCHSSKYFQTKNKIIYHPFPVTERMLFRKMPNRNFGVQWECKGWSYKDLWITSIQVLREAYKEAGENEQGEWIE